jgi:hypothetical protein
MAVTFGCNLSSSVPATDPPRIHSMAQQAGRRGFGSIWLAERLVIPRNVLSISVRRQNRDAHVNDGRNPL